MDKRVISLALCAMLLALCVPAAAEQPAKVPRIGYLTGTREPTHDAPDANRDAFRQGLRDLGYIEGKNILIEYRYAAGKQDPIPSFVAELVQLKVDVLVSPTLPGIRAAMQATKKIPIVMVTNWTAGGKMQGCKNYAMRIIFKASPRMLSSWFDYAHHDPELGRMGRGSSSKSAGFPLKACGNDGTSERRFTGMVQRNAAISRV